MAELASCCYRGRYSLMTTVLRSSILAGCVRVLSTRRSQPSTPASTSRRHPYRRPRPGRRRPRSLATPGSGTCRPAKCWPRQVVGERLSPRHELDSGLHQRRRLRRHVRVRHQGSRRDLRIVPGRHADRSRHPTDLRQRSGVRRHHRSLSAGQQILERRQPRRPLPRREVQPVVRIPPEPGGDRRARHRRSCQPARSTPASAPASRTWSSI